MPGIEDDIARAKAAGFVLTGFSGRAMEYEIYTCARSGLRLAIPLGNAGYIVRAPFPDDTVVLQTGMIDEACAYIARSPAHPAPDIQSLQSEEELRASVARLVQEARARPSVPVFVPLDGRRPRRAEEPDAARDPPFDGAHEPAARGRRGRRGEGTARRLARAAVLLVVGVPLAALAFPALGWGITGVLLLPMMYFLGLGRAACVVGGAVAGAAWAAAASTWARPRTIVWVSAAVALGAVAYRLTGLAEEFFGGGSPVYGGIAAASLVSAAQERPVVRGPLLGRCAVAGGAVGAIAGGAIDASTPQAALWLSAVTVHGLIAVSIARPWGRR